MPERIQPKDIEQTLKHLISEAIQVSPLLANRLDEMWRWIRDKKPGQLMSKRYVIKLLVELCRDSQVWLALNTLEPVAKKAFEEEMSPTERYWYTELFPRWFNERDPKLPTWQKKLMAGEFSQKDQELIDDLCGRINRQEGSSWNSYILDLSMATDLIVSGVLAKPLCVQLTQSQDQFTADKKEKWELTLRYWQIQRGLFVSFNPMGNRNTLESRLRQESDRSPAIGYNEIEI
jgi:hypothetical protein